MDRWLVLIISGLLLLQNIAAGFSPAPRAMSQATVTATSMQDACEPNDHPERACVLTLDQVNGPFTMLPPGDQDYYSIDLGSTPRNHALLITVRSTSGLDLLTTITRAGETTALALISSPAISTTLPLDLMGWLLVRVENRAASIPSSESYTLELRDAPDSASAGATSVPLSGLPDALENNWRPETAAPIAIGVTYDLTFVCPETRADACPGGDHDYLRVPVKAGTPYQIAAYDLAPGVDPVLELFWGDLHTAAAANDDAFSGGFASLLQWTAPANGELLIRVAPRNGAQQAIVPTQASTSTTNTSASSGYHLTVSLLHSQQASQILARIAAAAQVSLATPRPTAAPDNNQAASTAGASSPARPPEAATTRPSPASDAPKGPAIVIAPAGTALREGPGAGTTIQMLLVEQHVQLLGQASGAWVRVQPDDGVVPGWAYGPHIRPLGTALSATPAGSAAVSTTALPSEPGQAPATTTLPAQITITRLADRPLPAAPTALPHMTLALVVQLGVLTTPSTRSAAAHSIQPTLPPFLPIVGMRVQLVNVFGDVLSEVLTPSSGQVTLTRAVAPDTALHIRLPAAGLDMPITLDQAQITILLPGGRP